MKTKTVWFLEEIGNGWISKTWFLKMFAKWPNADYDTYYIKSETGLGSLIYTKEGNPLTLDPNDALVFNNKSAASDGHTFLRNRSWYSTPTLLITEHQFL